MIGRGGLLRRLLFPTTIFGWLLQTVSFVFLALLYAEVVHHLVVIGFHCQWPKLDDDPSGNRKSTDLVRVFIAADPHILGHRFGHWFDRLRREWAMQRSYHSAFNLIRPAADATFVLGDLTDEGEYSMSADEMAEYKRRFDVIFNPNSLCPVIALVGNHDVGFHYKFDAGRMKQFDSKFVGNQPKPSSSVRLVQLGPDLANKPVNFVLLNSMAFEGDSHCQLCEEARANVEKLSKRLVGDGANKSLPGPFLFQHFPLYRESDAVCPESPHSAPESERSVKMRPKMDCLSKEATSLLLRRFQPRLVVSGHTHFSCKVTHQVPDSEATVDEISVPSFSWRNNKAPAMLLLVATHDRHAVAECPLADERTIFNFYTAAGVFLVVFSVLRPIVLSLMWLCHGSQNSQNSGCGSNEFRTFIVDDKIKKI